MRLLLLVMTLLASAGCGCFPVNYWRLDRTRNCLVPDESLSHSECGPSGPAVTGCVVDSKGEIYETNVGTSPPPGGHDCTADEHRLVSAAPDCS